MAKQKRRAKDYTVSWAGGTETLPSHELAHERAAALRAEGHEVVVSKAKRADFTVAWTGKGGVQSRKIVGSEKEAEALAADKRAEGFAATVAKKKGIARKESDVPTRIYSYGCLPPTAGLGAIEEQLRLAHHYKKRLIEIEHVRRAEVATEMQKHGEVGVRFTEVEALKVKLDAAIAAVKAKRTGAGRRANTTEEGCAVRTLKAELKAARALLKEARLAVKNDARLQEALDTIAERAHQSMLDARAASGVRHAGYDRCEKAVKQASRGPKPPRFPRYDGTGWIGMQLTATTTKTAKRVMGMTVPELFSCQDTRLQLEPTPARAYDPTVPVHERRRLMRTSGTARQLEGKKGTIVRNPVVRIRIGTTGSEGMPRSERRPVWAEFPVILHRPLPPDSVIKWAYVVRKRIGIHFKYFLQLTLESETFRMPERPTGQRLAVNFGWRNKPDGRIRVAYWRNDKGEEGEMLLPESVQLRMVPDKSEHPMTNDVLGKARDDAFERVRGELCGWLDPAERNGTFADVPAWLVERHPKIATWPTWRGKHRLGAVYRRWAKDRFKGDAAIFGALQAWVAEDARLAGQMRRVVPDDLRSVRDQLFDIARAWLKYMIDLSPVVPDTLREKLRYMAQWRAPRKLATVLAHWYKDRFPGDEDMVAGLMSWAKKDRHLLLWEAYQRNRALGHRKDMYRRWAAAMARQYRSIVIDNFNIPDVSEAPAVEDGVPSDGRRTRKTERLAAPGELRSCLVQAAGKYGADIIELEAAQKTQLCHVCRVECEPWDAAPDIMHTCSNPACGAIWDQDANNCQNLLYAASGNAPPKPADSLAEEKAAKRQDKPGTHEYHPAL